MNRQGRAALSFSTAPLAILFSTDHLIDDPVFQSFLSGHEVIPVHVLLNLFDGLTRSFRGNLNGSGAGFQNSLSAYRNVACLTLCAPVRLMDHDFTVWQCETLSFRAGKQEKRSERSGESDADRMNGRSDILHRVKNGKSRRC